MGVGSVVAVGTMGEGVGVTSVVVGVGGGGSGEGVGVTSSGRPHAVSYVNSSNPPISQNNGPSLKVHLTGFIVFNNRSS